MFQNQFSQVLRKVSRYPRNFSTQRTLSPRKMPSQQFVRTWYVHVYITQTKDKLLKARNIHTEHL